MDSKQTLMDEIINGLKRFGFDATDHHGSTAPFCMIHNAVERFADREEGCDYAVSDERRRVEASRSSRRDGALVICNRCDWSMSYREWQKADVDPYPAHGCATNQGR